MTTSNDDEAAKDAGVGRLITALGIAQICSWGSLYYSFPLIAEAMRAELGWSKPEVFGAATLGMMLAGLAAYPVGAAIDRGRGRLVMGLASAAAGLLLAAWSTVTNIVVFYAILAALGCLQAATLYDAGFAVIARRVGAGNARHGIVTLTLWGGFASTVFIPLVQLLIDGFGWRGALLCLGLINLLCGALQYSAIDPAKDRSHGHMQEPSPVIGRIATARALRRPVFWFLVLAVMSYAAASSALGFHFYPLLIERGLSASGAVTVMAVIGPAQVAGRVLIWRFMPNAPVRTVGSLIVVAFPVATIGFAWAPPDVLVIAVIAAFYGAANGILTIVRGLSVPEMVSREAYGAINGAVVAPMNLMQAIAPLAAAWIWSVSGGYDAVLAVILAATVLLVASFWAAAMVSKPG